MSSFMNNRQVINDNSLLINIKNIQFIYTLLVNIFIDVNFKEQSFFPEKLNF